MSIYYPGCDETITAPICSDCPEKELAGIRSLFFVHVGFSFTDISDPTEWETGICDEDIYVFPRTRGSLEMSEQMSEGFGDIPEDLDGYDFTISVKDPNYLDNCDFWNSIKRSLAYRVGYRTETKIYLSDKAAVIVPKAPIAEDLKTKVVWEIVAKFTQEDIPCPLTMPVGIFEKCIACSS